MLIYTTDIISVFEYLIRGILYNIGPKFLILIPQIIIDTDSSILKLDFKFGLITIFFCYLKFK